MSTLQANNNFRGFGHWQNRRRFPPNYIEPQSTNFPNGHVPLEYTNNSSILDHRAVAKNFIKLHPALKQNGMKEVEKKTDYELSQSTYRDTFRKHAKLPSIGDYMEIAENVVHQSLPDCIKYHYRPELTNERAVFSRDPDLLKTVNVIVQRPTDKILRTEKLEGLMKIPRKFTDNRIPPKITDMGAIYYRNDLSPECMPRNKQSLDDFVKETQANTMKFLREREFPRDETETHRIQRRYTNFTVY